MYTNTRPAQWHIDTCMRLCARHPFEKKSNIKHVWNVFNAMGHGSSAYMKCIHLQHKHIAHLFHAIATGIYSIRIKSVGGGSSFYRDDRDGEFHFSTKSKRERWNPSDVYRNILCVWKHIRQKWGAQDEQRTRMIDGWCALKLCRWCRSVSFYLRLSIIEQRIQRDTRTGDLEQSRK